MTFQDKIAHAAAVAKWKADQQMRLLKSQSRIGEIESQIRAEKSALADKTLALYAQEQLAEDDLKQICAAIAALHGQIKEQQSLQESARSERPPEQQAYSATYPPTQPAELQTETLSGLICPQCNRSLIGRFCPEHGVEGVEPSQSSESTQTNNAIYQMVCPKCGKPLSVRFCPEHGVEGIPQEKL
jgi:DNA repair exonuclease SbcCD ATPase subunit